MSPDPQVTIVVPNWNTGPLLRVCLASVLRHTRVGYRVVVVDNGSSDASRDTAEAAEAKGLIHLIRRDDEENRGAPSHGAALDAGLTVSDTPLLFTLDSDAWARREGWLGRYVHHLTTLDASHAGAVKFPSGSVHRVSSWLRGKRPGAESRYVRPCHALYRVDLLRRYELSFTPRPAEDGRKRTTGQVIHERLVGLGYRPAFLGHEEVERLVGHVRHATMVLNAGQFPGLRAKARWQGNRRIERFLEGREVARVLADSPVP